MQRHNPLCHSRGSQGCGVLGADLQSWGLTQNPSDASHLVLLSDATGPMNPPVLKVRFPLKWRILWKCHHREPTLSLSALAWRGPSLG